VVLASRGLRDMDDGAQPIRDEKEARQLRAQAKKVYLESIAVALLLTALAVLIPRR